MAAPGDESLPYDATAHAAAASAAADGPLVGRILAERYRLIARLGEGGMASVYLARHLLIDRLSAIKFLHASLSADAENKDRFLREARAVNRINHPNIVEITDFGEADGLTYLVMEYVAGEPLSAILDRGAIGWRRAAHVGVRLTAALGRAHELGVIHRDLKPSNVLVVARRDGNDLVKLTDFGVAKLGGARTLTDSAVALGTPGYVAPEYREYGNVDARSDLYALGVVLYEATCGVRPKVPQHRRPLEIGPREPLDGDIARAAAAAASEKRAPLDALDPEVPGYFARIVEALLSTDPDDRPRDGFEAHELLKRALELHPPAEAPAPPAAPPDPTEPPPSRAFERIASLASLAPPAWQPPPLVRARPHLMTAPFDRLAPSLKKSLERLEDVVAIRPREKRTAVVDELVVDARRLVVMASRLADLSSVGSSAVDDVERRARSLQQHLGARLDELAREHSRSLGWATKIEERHERVRSERDTGAHPIAAMDAMVWEQAALEVEGDRARSHVASLRAQIDELRAEVLRTQAELEHERRVLAAKHEGQVAALRAVSLEAWGALRSAAEACGSNEDALLE